MSMAQGCGNMVDVSSTRVQSASKFLVHYSWLNAAIKYTTLGKMSSGSVGDKSSDGGKISAWL